MFIAATVNVVQLIIALSEFNLLRDLVDLVGIEPTTSSMPFLISECGRAMQIDLQRYATSTSVGC
jgi:hypothetical protein